MAARAINPITSIFQNEGGVNTEINSFLLEGPLSSYHENSKTVTFTVGKKLGVQTTWDMYLNLNCKYKMDPRTPSYYVRRSDMDIYDEIYAYGKPSQRQRRNIDDDYIPIPVYMASFSTKITSLKIFSYAKYNNVEQVDASLAASVKHRMKLSLLVEEKSLGVLLCYSCDQDGLEMDAVKGNTGNALKSELSSSFKYDIMGNSVSNLEPKLTVKLEISSSLASKTVSPSLEVDTKNTSSKDSKDSDSLLTEQISEDLAKAFETGEHYDVLIKVSGSKGKGGKNEPSLAQMTDSDSSTAADISTPTDFKAHKVILAARSVKLRNLFAAGNKTEVFIRGISPEAMKIFLHFLYTGKLAEGWEDVVEELINTGKKLGVSSLFPLFDKCLIKACNEDNYGKLLYLAQANELTTAKDDIRKFLTNSETK